MRKRLSAFFCVVLFPLAGCVADFEWDTDSTDDPHLAGPTTLQQIGEITWRQAWRSSTSGPF